MRAEGESLHRLCLCLSALQGVGGGLDREGERGDVEAKRGGGGWERRGGRDEKGLSLYIIIDRKSVV